MKFLPLLVLFLAGPVLAQTVPWNESELTWTAPTTFVDGSPIPAGLTTTYIVEHMPPNSTWRQLATTSNTRYRHTGITVMGLHSYRIYAVVNGVTSAASNVGTKTVTQPAPNPPVLTVAQVVAGVDHSPVFTVIGENTRGATVAGFAPVGTPCEGPTLFTYRGKAYGKPIEWKPWATSTTANVATACS